MTIAWNIVKVVSVFPARRCSIEFLPGRGPIRRESRRLGRTLVTPGRAALRSVVVLASAAAPPAVVRGQGGRCSAGGQDRYRCRFWTGPRGHQCSWLSWLAGNCAQQR
jgi:hypothetical protein